MLGYAALSPVSFCGSLVPTAPSLLHASLDGFHQEEAKALLGQNGPVDLTGV